MLAVALLAALAFRVHPAAVLNELGKADFYWIPALLGANLVSDWFRALRWQQQLPADRRPRVMLLFFSAHIGSAVNFLIPLRAGEAIRLRIVNQRTGIEPAALVATIFGEILSDLMTLSVYIAIGLALLPEAAFLWPIAVVAGVATALCLAGGYMLARRGEEWSGPPGTPGARGWIGRQLYNFARGLAPLREPRRFLVLILTAQGTWIFETLMFYMSGQALGVDLSFSRVHVAHRDGKCGRFGSADAGRLRRVRAGRGRRDEGPRRARAAGGNLRALRPCTTDDAASAIRSAGSGDPQGPPL